MKIVTYNIRCRFEGDGINSFVNRAGLMLNKINEEKPDIIAFQEVTDKISEFLRNNLCGYELVGHGRNADYFGEGVYFAYRRETVRLFELESFWLSGTPHVPASRLEGQSSCPRTCLAGLFCIDKTVFRVYNLHLDHLNNNSNVREKEAEQIIMHIKSKDGDFPCFVVGDFNASPNEKCIKMFEENGFADSTHNVGVTFHNFGGKNYKNGKKIDYIFTDKKAHGRLKKVDKWKDEQGGIFLSDHYPIEAEYKI